ncbi:unnamed protein product [Tuber melanosporum]|uniref:(Perigord truffle) hypothetical protein n=1 Tax=Tuber melanosporum (strain Mel28) TaxID=656061 RepID=D5GB88_TUBMM|nr:uncharacterized protein GSTUM_00003795001 [Tuber melanosporum]CAZ81781.1 unnamed protein product [Tuber melanosporum]
MSQVCRFYQRGHCKFGSNCNFLHPGAITSAPNAFGGARNSFGGGGIQTKLTDGFTIPSADTIRLDLSERPTWCLSSYAPSKDSPAQLIDGKDISPEEARVMAYRLRAEGIPQAYEVEWNRLTSEVSSQIRNILDNIPGAIEFLKNAQGAPSRYNSARASSQQQTSPFGDQNSQQGIGASSSSAQTPSSSPFGQVQQPRSASGFTSAFSTPTPFGARPTPAFGQSPFGQQVAQQTAQQPAASASAAPVFGQPAFGTPSQPQSAFGRPAFGQPAFGQPAFGQSSSLGSQPSPFAAAASNAAPAPPSAFGQPAFGVSSGPKPAFGQPAFGKSAFSQAQSSPFAAAATSPFVQAAGSSTTPFTQVPPTSSFGQSSQSQTASPANPFGSPPQQGAANPFQQTQAAQASPSPFSSTNPFQQSQQQQQATSTPFSQATQGPAQAPTSPFGQPTQPVNSFGSPAPQSSPFSTQNPFQGAQQGQASSSALRTHEMNPQLREQQKTKKWDDPVIEYTPEEQAMFSAGSFVLGQVPTVAPSRNMCWG